MATIDSPKTLADKARRWKEIDEEVKKLSEEQSGISEDLKPYVEKHGLPVGTGGGKVCVADDLEIRLTVRTYTDIDEAKAESVLKANRVWKECVEVVHRIDKAAIEEQVKRGNLTPKDVQRFVTLKQSSSVKVTGLKKK